MSYCPPVRSEQWIDGSSQDASTSAAARELAPALTEGAIREKRPAASFRERRSSSVHDAPGPVKLSIFGHHRSLVTYPSHEKGDRRVSVKERKCLAFWQSVSHCLILVNGSGLKKLLRALHID